MCERKELFFKRPLPFFTLLPIIDPMINIMPELTPVFTAYEALVAEADAVFARVGEMHPDCVTCKPGCSDCCHAMFDLSLVEAMYLNARFIEKYDFGPERSRILENAGSVDRKLTRMKRDYFRELRDAKGSEDAMEHIMEEAAKARIRCPLLDSNGWTASAWKSGIACSPGSRSCMRSSCPCPWRFSPTTTTLIWV